MVLNNPLQDAVIVVASCVDDAPVMIVLNLVDFGGMSWDSDADPSIFDHGCSYEMNIAIFGAQDEMALEHVSGCELRQSEVVIVRMFLVAILVEDII